MKKILFLILCPFLLYSCGITDQSSSNATIELENKLIQLEELVSLQSSKLDSQVLKLKIVSSQAKFANMSLATQSSLIGLNSFIGDCNACFDRVYGDCLKIGKLEISIKCMEGRREAYVKCLEACKAYNTLSMD